MRTADPVKSVRILEAAAQLFAERHYHEVRMDDIAAKAGVAKGTIYLHFKDKDDLYRALSVVGFTELVARIRFRLGSIQGAEDRLLALNREVIRYFSEQSYTLDLFHRVERLQEESGCGKGDFSALRDEIASILRSILEDFPQASGRDESEISRSVLAFIGMTKEVLRESPRPWPSDLPDWLTRVFLRGFLQPRDRGSATSH